MQVASSGGDGGGRANPRHVSRHHGRARSMLLRDARHDAEAPSRRREFRSAPLSTPKVPPGVLHIISNEAAERFSFYGMKAILVVFMTNHMHNTGGGVAHLSDAEAREYYHMFTSAVYITPLGGALVAEVLAGKFRTIIWFSLIYCAGHLALALDETTRGLTLGLGLIALGAGGIKPCVSAHVGDQFGEMNRHLISRTFGFFYLAINLGAFTSTLLTPYLLEHAGSHVAFGVPGIAMALATLIFWAGRYSYAHIPAGGQRFWRETCSSEGGRALGKLLGLYLFVAVYYSLYDQTGSAWVLQARKMERYFLGVEWLPSQISAINPLLILLLVPLFHGVEVAVPSGRWGALFARCGLLPGQRRRLPGLYDLAARLVRVTPLRKMSVGFFVTALAFAIPWQIEASMEAAAANRSAECDVASAAPLPCATRPSIGWQLLAYAVLTTAEVLVSVTGLEFSYTQAPPRMKSVVMACYLGATSMGNAITVLVNVFIQNPDGSSRWTDVEYYRFFALIMLGTAVAFVPFAAAYQEKTFVQSSIDDGERGVAVGETSSTSVRSLVGADHSSKRLPNDVELASDTADPDGARRKH